VPRKHKAHEDEHVNHEAWVIPYADLLTLLLAMFLALWASSNADAKKVRQLAAAFQSQIGTGQATPIDPPLAGSDNPSVFLAGGDGILDLGGLQRRVDELKGKLVDQVLEEEQAEQAARDEEVEALEEAKANVAQLIIDAGLEGKVEAVTTSEGLLITLSSDELLFASGSADLLDASALDRLAVMLNSVPNDIKVIGHTDSIPLSGGPFGSNLGLSSVRAANVGNYLIERLGVDPGRVTTAGSGDLRPIADNTTPEGRAQNRRVEITLLAQYAPLTPSPSAESSGSSPGASSPSTPTDGAEVNAAPTGASNG
jgi:chemotaxis protein MotB